jgi:hypothetical protein
MSSEKVLRRLIFISGMNGWCVTALAGMCTLTSLVMGSWSGVIICLAITVSGYMELKGRQELKRERPEARMWLTGSQLWLLFIIVSYAGYQLLVFDPSNMLKDIPQADQQALKGIVESNAQLLCTMYKAVYISVIIASFIYQGGLWLYYRRDYSRLFSSAIHNYKGAGAS